MRKTSRHESRKVIPPLLPRSSPLAGRSGRWFWLRTNVLMSATQSRSVASTRWAGAGGAHGGGDGLVAGLGGLGVAGPQLRPSWSGPGARGRSRCRRRRGCRPAAARAHGGRRSARRSTWWWWAMACSGSAQPSSRKSETTTTRPRRRRRRARVSRASAQGGAGRRRPLGPRTVVEAGQAGHDGEARRRPGCSRSSSSPPGHEELHVVAALERQQAEGGGGGQGDVALLLQRRAEVEAGRAVDHDPGLQLAVGVGGAHLGGQRAGGDVPVDAAGLVAGAVGPHAGRLAAGAAADAEELAAHEAVEAPADEQVEPAQHGGPLRHGARRCIGHAGTLAGIEDGGGGMATMSCWGATRGAVMVLSKRRMRSSVVTLEASAS